MSIVIRDIKRLGEGDGARTSIRERRIGERSITLGRMAGSDIQIDDLSVQRAQASIEVIGYDLARLSLNSGATAHIDGRLISSGTANLRVGSIIRIGGTEIRVIPTAELKSVKADGDAPLEHALALSVEQIDNPASAIVDLDAKRTFDPASVLPSRRILSWVGGIAVLGFFLIWPILNHSAPEKLPEHSARWVADSSWNSGPLSSLHSNLDQDCASCHTDAFKPVSDTSCTSCHADQADHAQPPDLSAAMPMLTGFDAQLQKVSNAFGRTEGRCASCHVEHNGSAHIIEASDKICTDCHTDLDTRLPSTDLGNVSSFDGDHPQFRPFIITEADLINPVTKRVSLDLEPKGHSGLKFPHDIHLRGDGAVARMASTLPARYDFSDGVNCEDCHAPEAGGALFDPVRMEQDCAMCHALTFEVEDGGYERTLRHGEPEEVIASMRDFYDAKALANIRDIASNSSTRRRPGSASRIRELNQRELAFQRSAALTAAKVNDIFSEGGACFDCHDIDRPEQTASLDFIVKPISVSDQFYRRSPFNHSAHEIEGLDCESCHAASTSASSDDILLPKIEICRDCHISEDRWKEGHADVAGQIGAFPTNCLTCHAYHDGDHAEAATQLSEARAAP